MDPSLQSAYRTCRRIQRAHDPTYYYATRCLRPEVRPAVYAVYGFVRGGAMNAYVINASSLG